MDYSYFQKINNMYDSKSRQETDLYLLNRHVDRHFDNTIDYHEVKRNGQPFELMIIKDTDSNTYKKKIKSRHSQPFNLGDYIEWNGQHWLVTLLDTDDKTYHSGYMYQCSILLRWQNSAGDIVERWAYSEDFTKYSSGETGNSTITLGDYQYGLTLPVDDETKVIKRGKRFPIDLEGVEPPDIYKLTNRKILLNDATSFNRGGTLVWTLTFDEFNQETDKKVQKCDGTYVWIADYYHCEPCKKTQQTSVLFKIEYVGLPMVRCGNALKTFTGIISNNKDYMEGYWSIDCPFVDKITIIETGNQIQIGLSDEYIEYVGETFKLKFSSADGLYHDEIDVEIGSYV